MSQFDRRDETSDESFAAFDAEPPTSGEGGSGDSSSFGEGVVAESAPSKPARKKRARRSKPAAALPSKSDEGEPEEAPPKRARRSRRKSAGADAEPEAAAGPQSSAEDGAAPEDGASAEDGEEGGGRRRSSRSRSTSAKRRADKTRKALASAPEGEGEDDAEEAPPKRSRRRSTKRSRAAAAEEAVESAPEERRDDDERDADEEGERKPRRRRRSRSKRKSTAEAAEGEAESSDDRRDDDEEGDNAKSAGTKKKSRRRGSRGGRRRKRSDIDGALTLDAIPGEDDDFALESVEVLEAAGEEGSRRSLGRARRGEDGDKHAETAERGVKRKVSGRRKKAKAGANAEKGKSEKSKDGEEAPSKAARARSRAVPDVPRDQLILVNAVDPEENRVVVVQGDRIVDLQMTVAQHKSYVNDIYRGRVVNLEPAIGAAFVDFGQGRNGFLHVSDVMEFYGDKGFSLESLLTAKADEDELEGKGPKGEDVDGEEKPKKKASRERRRPSGRGRRKKGIADMLDKGQLVVGQITKDAIGDKGPTLTTYISIPGRYLVLMPSLPRTGVSRKIEDEKERRRLKRILTSLDIPEGMGVIVRTAGVGKTKSEIKRDLEYLLAVWKDFSTQLVLGRSPAPLYQESDVAIRTMRDLFNARTEKVLVDDPQVYEKMVEFTKRLMPEHVERIELHDGARPLFHTHGVEQDFEKIFSRRIDLPSGGSIVLDQTEALVAIDVNSGRTRDEGADFEDIALKTNLEAVPEIARQIKLRDLGGILVLDFIDMMRLGSRKQVEKALRECLAEDRARSKVGRISQFGLLEMTRQRLGPGLSKLIYEPCSYCRGSGRRRTAQSKAQALLRRLGSALTQKGFTKIEILAHPDTIEWLTTKDAAELQHLKEKSKRELVFKAVEDQLEDSIFHYLRADGREVRPGGRRKR
ncbi:MAG: Rne/Rng family ribonuclease [Planctomycetota bacterium]|jgi:ribonuclease E